MRMEIRDRDADFWKIWRRHVVGAGQMNNLKKANAWLYVAI